MEIKYRENANRKDQEIREKVKQNGTDYLLTDAEVRARLGGICRQTMHVLVQSGRFPKPMFIGSKKYWRDSICNAWLQAQQPSGAY